MDLAQMMFQTPLQMIAHNPNHGPQEQMQVELPWSLPKPGLLLRK